MSAPFLHTNNEQYGKEIRKTTIHNNFRKLKCPGTNLMKEM
jgi:hypothetical protein